MSRHRNPNRYEVVGGVLFVYLRSKKYGERVTRVSVEHRERVLSLTWYPLWVPRINTFYAGAKINGRHVSLHNFIVSPTHGMEVDHVDHDGLNNLDSNLRAVTVSENQQNRLGPNRNTTTGFRCVRHDKRWNRYRAQIRFQKKDYYLGSSTTPEGAYAFVESFLRERGIPFGIPSK